MPNEVPKVDELGVSSAPLKSASFYIGTFCKPYSGNRSVSCQPPPDIHSAPGSLTALSPELRGLYALGPSGDPMCSRGVSSPSSQSLLSAYPLIILSPTVIPPSITKIKAACLDEFTSHWKCLDRNNHGFEFCRKPEKDLNASIQKRNSRYSKWTSAYPREEEPNLRPHPTI
ncbi:hypothetical protein PTTG_05155, partial [Puccinia triticina 1-1 BBBD Race 1]